MSEQKKPLESAETLKRFKDRKPRRLRALLAVALIAALGFMLFYLVRPQSDPEYGDTASTGVVLIAREKALLHSITVAATGDAPYTLINLNDYDLSNTNDVIGKEYAVDGNPDFAVSTAQVLSMERYASDLKAEDMAARSPEDPDQYGLKSPKLTVTIGYRDSTKETLHFGGAVPTGDGYYLTRDDDQAVYIVADSVYEAFCRKLSDLKQTDQEKADLVAAQAVYQTSQKDSTVSDTTAAPGTPAGADQAASPAATPAPGVGAEGDMALRENNRSSG